MTDLLIRDVRLASGSSADLGIQGSRLVDPGSLVNPRIIDASGLIALPGLVDLHTHLRQPSPQPAETIASGTAAAARGGFTAVFAMANTDPVTDTADKVRRMRHLATGASSEVVPVGAVTQGLRGTHLAEIEAMCAAGVRVFSDDGRCVMDAHLMREALHITGRHDAVIAQHSQDHDLAGATAYQPDADPGDCADWPWAAEAVIVARDTQLALDTGARVHVCHVSTAESVEVLRWAKARHIPITAEVTPHHLLLDTALLTKGDATFKVNPPLRRDEDRQALRQALADGVIDVVGTDHAPHLSADKTLPLGQAKPGMVGLEWALGIVIETTVLPGLMDWSTLAARMSHTPARIGRISPHQGCPVAPDQPANFVLVDPTRRSTVDKDHSLSQGRNNPYHGLDLPDPVVATFWAGRPTYLSPMVSAWKNIA